MLIFLYGKTGSGKDFLASRLIEDLVYYRAKRPTTRPMRSEKEKEYYSFYSEEEYDKMVSRGDILFDRSFRGWKYGVFKEVVSKVNDEDIFVMTGDKGLAFDLKKTFTSNLNLLLVEVKADETERLRRVSIREKTPNMTEIRRRMISDDKDYAEIDSLPDYYFESSPNQIKFKIALRNLSKFIEFTTKEKNLKC